MNRRRLMQIYSRLYRALGPRHWWPARSPQEIMIGAILTQNTAWSNVEKAIAALRARRALTFRGLRRIDPDELAALIRPARFMNQKARALHCFADYFGGTYGFSIKKMSARTTGELRRELLSQYRIGPETADSILLYALEKPVFVIDAYTRRILSRHGMLSENAGYDAFQNLFMKHLPADVPLFNEYHALLVHVGNRYCSPKPRCGECPLNGY